MGTWRPGKIWKAKVKIRRKKHRENYGNIRKTMVTLGKTMVTLGKTMVTLGENYGNIREKLW